MEVEKSAKYWVLCRKICFWENDINQKKSLSARNFEFKRNAKTNSKRKD